jgi:hypothetical protein
MQQGVVGRWALVENDTQDGRHPPALLLSDDQGRAREVSYGFELAPP